MKFPDPEAPEGFLPPFFTMIADNLLLAPQFSLWLNPDPLAQLAGELVLGGVDNAHYTGQLNTIPVTTRS